MSGIIDNIAAKFNGRKDGSLSVILDSDILVSVIYDFEEEVMDSIMIETVSDYSVGLYPLSIMRISPSGDIEKLRDYDEFAQESGSKEYIDSLAKFIVSQLESGQVAVALTPDEKHLAQEIRQYLADREESDIIDMIYDDVTEGKSLEEAIQNQKTHIYYLALLLELGSDKEVEEALTELYIYAYGKARSEVLRRMNHGTEVHGCKLLYSKSVDMGEYMLHKLVCDKTVKDGNEAAHLIMDSLVLDDRVAKILRHMSKQDVLELNDVEVDMEEIWSDSKMAVAYDEEFDPKEVNLAFCQKLKYKRHCINERFGPAVGVKMVCRESCELQYPYFVVDRKDGNYELREYSEHGSKLVGIIRD